MHFDLKRLTFLENFPFSYSNFSHHQLKHFGFQNIECTFQVETLQLNLQELQEEFYNRQQAQDQQQQQDQSFSDGMMN